MPGNLSTLYELCLRKTARQLKSSYWDPDLPWTRNPFALLPSAVIDTLVTYVTRMSTSKPLLSSDLRLLLTSGRVRELILEDDDDDEFDVAEESVRRILIDLSTSCRNLIVAKIRLPICVPWDSSTDSELECVARTAVKVVSGGPMVSLALGSLLSEAQNIKHIETTIKFDFRAIASCVQLEKLVLDFEFENHLCDFLKINGEMRHHTSLKHLEVSKFIPYNISYLDVAFILQYCTELISINIDISRSLKHLHALELKNGTLTHKYKIQKCRLGVRYRKDVLASRDHVLLASATCPDLRELTMTTTDDEAISALGDLDNLTALKIWWKTELETEWETELETEWETERLADYYSVGMQSLLEKPNIGHNLKRLTLYGFANVDFISIGMCCPNLEKLKAMDVSEKCTRNQYSPTSFRKLRFLKLENTNLEKWNYATLVGILSNATDLKRLEILSAGELTDDVLKVILTKNSLSHLTHLSVVQCGLSLRGWRNLARSLRALKRLTIHGAAVRIGDITVAVQNVNPRIIMDSDDDDTED